MKKKISENEKPEIYAVNRGKRGWKLSRRNFIAGAATMGAALAGKELVPKAGAQEAMPSPETAPGAACAQVWAHSDEISGLVFSRDGNFLASSSFDNKVKLWDVAKQGHLHTYEDHKGDVRALAFSQDGKWLISGSNDKTVKVWNMKNNKLRKNFTKHDGEVYGVSVLPGSKEAVSVTQNGNYMLWRVPAGGLIKSWKSTFTVYYVWSLAVSPNGNLLATGHYNKISLWSLKEGERGKLFKEINDNRRIHELAFSPNGKWLVAGSSYEDNLRVWNIPGGSLKKEFRAQSSGKRVHSLAITPDSKYVASGGYNDRVRVHTLPEGKIKYKIGPKTTYAKSLAFSPDGKILAIGNDNGTIELWSFPDGNKIGCLMDTDANQSWKSGITYKYLGISGKWIEVTVPVCQCAPPMPVGAVCVCNTVPGCGCVGHTCSCVGYTCSCVGYGCTCVGHCIHFHYWYPN